MSRTYYRLWYRLDAIDGYLIWYSNDIDGLVTQSGDSIPRFRDLAALEAYASEYQIVLQSEEPRLHDLDVIVRWLQVSRSTAVDCAACLTAWNLFGDLATSINRQFDHDHVRTQRLYDTLFWGNNLPSVTPRGRHYIPEWTDDERLVLHEILQSGLLLFRTHVIGA